MTLAIVHIEFCQPNGTQFVGIRIARNMQFTPDTASLLPMCSHFPFPFTVDFKSCRVNHGVSGYLLIFSKTFEFNLKCASTAAVTRIMGNSQVQTKQAV